MDRIAKGERILIDGATGTEIERCGVPQLENAWNGGGALSHPDVLRSVHEDYIREGAEIVVSNTFATHRHALRDAGVEHQFETLNRRGVELAMEAPTADIATGKPPYTIVSIFDGFAVKNWPMLCLWRLQIAAKTG